MTAWNFESALVPVTGGASGIGFGICQRLRDEGATPLILDVNTQNIDNALNELYGDIEDRSKYGYVLDVSDSKAVDHCFDRIHAQHGPITHLVANAGVNGGAHVLDITDEQWQRVIDVNLTGVMYVCRAAARHLVERKSGAIVNIASISGLMAKRRRIAYTSSKAAVINLTRALAMDLGEYGVRVNAVAPGVVLTPMQKMNAQEAVQALISRSALNRPGEVDEIANVVLFLLSELSSYVTGHTLTVDGGLTVNYAP